jgi:hypothetical protein
MKNIGILIDPQSGQLFASPTDDVNFSLAIGDVTWQNAAFIFTAHPGDYKELPTVGIGIDDLPLDNNLDLWRREIRRQLESEGFSLDTFDISPDKSLNLQLHYK